MTAKIIVGTIQFGDEEPVQVPFLLQQRPDDVPAILVPLRPDLADGDPVTLRFDWSAP